MKKVKFWWHPDANTPVFWANQEEPMTMLSPGNMAVLVEIKLKLTEPPKVEVKRKGGKRKGGKK